MIDSHIRVSADKTGTWKPCGIVLTDRFAVAIRLAMQPAPILPFIFYPLSFLLFALRPMKKLFGLRSACL